MEDLISSLSGSNIRENEEFIILEKLIKNGYRGSLNDILHEAELRYVRYLQGIEWEGAEDIRDLIILFLKERNNNKKLELIKTIDIKIWNIIPK